MVKIKGWKKMLDTPNRIYWQHKNKYIQNVEKLGNTWTYTYGTLNGQQYTRNYDSKQKALNIARKQMKLLYDDTPIRNIKTKDEIDRQWNVRSHPNG